MYIPTIFTVETFLGCSLRCPECACGTGKINRKFGYLSFEKFKIIASKIAPYAKYVFLHCWGEPLLNPDIIDIINYGQKLFQTQISTNAQNITEKMAEQLILSGTDICISLDGMSQEIYEKYRNLGNMQKAKDALNMLVSAKIKYGKNTNLQAQFIVFQHNQHQMSEFSKFCQDLGIIESFKAPSLYCNSSINASTLTNFIRNKLSEQQMKNCIDLKNVFTIYIDGSVVICCYDYNGKITFGNIFEQDVLEIYNSDKINLLRKTMPSEFCIKHCLA